MEDLLKEIDGFIWGIPLLSAILCSGIYFTIRTGFVQVRLFPKALRAFLRQIISTDDADGKSGFRALCTALSATVGTGNIVGVAGAIALGGPGAVFWMWIFGFFGMAVKFAEVVLALHFRKKQREGIFAGGPMYTIENGLGRKWKFLSAAYCLFGILAAFGVGNAAQINTVVSGLTSAVQSLGFSSGAGVQVALCIFLVVFFSVCFAGGSVRVERAAQQLIPFACIGYILLCIGAIFLHRQQLPGAVVSIFVGAFAPQAVTSGVLGSVFLTMKVGAARGLFTNEAGMGTASIAHAAAEVSHPVDQGLMGIVEVFLDTLVICTLTALVILTGNEAIQYGTDSGIALAISGFANAYGDGISIVITVFLCLFAIATVFGWSIYGVSCVRYLFGKRGVPVFFVLQVIVVALGALLQTRIVWLAAEIFNGLMAIPNLVALVGTSPVLVKLIDVYQKAPVHHWGAPAVATGSTDLR